MAFDEVIIFETQPSGKTNHELLAHSLHVVHEFQRSLLKVQYTVSIYSEILHILSKLKLI